MERVLMLAVGGVLLIILLVILIDLVGARR